VHDHDVSLARKSERGVLNRTLDRNDHRVTKHPIIASHPITGRKCLLATEGHTARICDLPSAESDALLAELWAHVRRPEFVYRHSWRVQDLVIWDNRSSQHQAIFDYGDLPRRIHRGETTGPAPVPAASASLEACRTAARPA
jgi:taurine dioxygenase